MKCNIDLVPKNIRRKKAYAYNRKIFVAGMYHTYIHVLLPLQHSLTITRTFKTTVGSFFSIFTIFLIHERKSTSPQRRDHRLNLQDTNDVTPKIDHQSHHSESEKKSIKYVPLTILPLIPCSTHSHFISDMCCCYAASTITTRSGENKLTD